MESYSNYHWHWWHWLVIIIVVIIALGVGYTLINNYEVVKRDNQSFTNGTQQVVEHPIDTTQNAVNDITNK